MDLQVMLGKNICSDKVSRNKVGKPSSSKGVFVALDNFIEFKTNLGGLGSSKNTFLAKRAC